MRGKKYIKKTSVQDNILNYYFFWKIC